MDLKSIKDEPKPNSDYLFISAFFSKDSFSTRPGKSQLCLGLSIGIDFFEKAKKIGVYESVKKS